MNNEIINTDGAAKIALVTGGSRGLGKDMALNLAKKGLHVVLTYQSGSTEADSVVAEIKAMGRKATAIQLDILQAGSYDAFITRLQKKLADEMAVERLDFLINNAGFIHGSSFAETSEEHFDQLSGVHFKGPFFLTQKLLPLLNDGGGIVNISTGLARFATPGYAAYAAMKGAMEVLTRYQAKELGDRGIRVNAVAPGAIETDIQGGAVRDSPELNKHIASVTALGRVGLPEDIGAVVAFLCTDEARWITAQRIEISGGMNL
ncbi:SDR family NAD(P)-dependent oxidoreductase [Pedobacter sp. SYP-B3415]|uniref:SDR family NAD(P)-dependent oxidoreductase n=1 Tax=Pedobacter sp. SYP-B3415 TaxID=2496641 RepID=UPI00101BFD51|nr:SDR family oxidoreductase [Pedobacter sp. SYP-B3415]